MHDAMSFTLAAATLVDRNVSVVSTCGAEFVAKVEKKRNCNLLTIG
jgi:hypothetical protein